MSPQAIHRTLEALLETEFTFARVDPLVEGIAALGTQEQTFLLDWTRRVAAANIQIAYEFARQAPALLRRMDRRVVEAWATHAMDALDRAGLREALRAVAEGERWAAEGERWAADGAQWMAADRAQAAVFEDVQGILANFVHGLAGRRLKLVRGDAAWTDSDTLYLPPLVARFAAAADNFALCKATVTLLWAQVRFGTFHADLAALLARPDASAALDAFHALETVRLEACIARELPGLARRMAALEASIHAPSRPAAGDAWATLAHPLTAPQACAADALARVDAALAAGLPPRPCYQGELRPQEVARVTAERVAREKMLLRVRLAELAQEITRGDSEAATEADPQCPSFGLRDLAEAGNDLGEMELVLNDLPVAPPARVADLLTSIKLDLGGIPPDYLVAAGSGEYDPALYGAAAADPDEVWQGVYHEQGASLYPEWDHRRQHYRKNWCVVREKDVPAGEDGFVDAVLTRYAGVVRQLRRSFEAMRDENRLLKRQRWGDDVDFDALVEAVADRRAGREMSEHLFLRNHRTERNIAVVFLVDMSGSTRGWVNDAERESLVLLTEALEALGDRYAIYGFSGTTRKRCEIYRIKTFYEPYGPGVRARIAGIRPQDYTRMGFAIRHMTRLLAGVDARTRLLVTLSDGKPDDYHDGYRGPYGIEDTRKALQEATRAGIRPFCITIDSEARDYLPHLYGSANWTLVEDVARLPLRTADIYRRLTG